MAVFAVLSKENNSKLATLIKEMFPNDYYEYSSNQWLISTKGTAKEVSDKIGISNKANDLSAVVFATSSYYGLTETTLWDWIKNKLENTDG
jgi:hypothetical protein